MIIFLRDIKTFPFISDGHIVLYRLSFTYFIDEFDERARNILWIPSALTNYSIAAAASEEQKFVISARTTCPILKLKWKKKKKKEIRRLFINSSTKILLSSTFHLLMRRLFCSKLSRTHIQAMKQKNLISYAISNDWMFSFTLVCN